MFIKQNPYAGGVIAFRARTGASGDRTGVSLKRRFCFLPKKPLLCSVTHSER